MLSALWISRSLPFCTKVRSPNVMPAPNEIVSKPDVSMMMSVPSPLSKTYVSLSSPPDKISLPVLPLSVSSPKLPISSSLSSLPFSVSLPRPPCRISLPRPPSRRSLPAFDQTMSSPSAAKIDISPKIWVSLANKIISLPGAGRKSSTFSIKRLPRLSSRSHNWSNVVPRAMSPAPAPPLTNVSLI